MCAGAAPDSAVINCSNTTCNCGQLICPELVQNNCTVTYYGSATAYATAMACSSNIMCPKRSGDCIVNCSNIHACNQVNMACPQGNCITNCDYSTSCQYLTANCSGGNCLINCEGNDTCQYSNIKCTSGICTLNCRGEGSCGNSTVLCSPYGYCNVYCESYSVTACQFSEFTCQAGGNCVFYFTSQTVPRNIGHFVSITCQENSKCNIVCTGNSTRGYYYSPYYGLCSHSHITCPRESGNCTVECSSVGSCHLSDITCGRNSNCLSCSGKYSCQRANINFFDESMPVLNCTGHNACRYIDITCPPNNNCKINCNGVNSCDYAEVICPIENECMINCDGGSSCSQARVTCPPDSNCNIHCDGQYSCWNARVTCPTGNYSCNILCTDPQSCSNLMITSTHNVYLQCCGSETRCAGTTVVPTSTECRDRDEITCSTESNCIINCNDWGSCYYTEIVCNTESNCTVNCDGDYSCYYAKVTCPSGHDCNINCAGYSSCDVSEIICPTNSNCTINCVWISCAYARVICPTGDYSCNILCTRYGSCSNLSITNTHNVYLQCCGSETRCAGPSVNASSIECL